MFSKHGNVGFGEEVSDGPCCGLWLVLMDGGVLFTLVLLFSLVTGTRGGSVLRGWSKLMLVAAHQQKRSVQLMEPGPRWGCHGVLLHCLLHLHLHMDVVHVVSGLGGEVHVGEAAQFDHVTGIAMVFDADLVKGALDDVHARGDHTVY